MARKNIRLQGYDYSHNGVYFVTICVKDSHGILWDDTGARPARSEGCTGLSDNGRIVESAIMNIPLKYSNIALDTYTIMPNHLHMILLVDSGRAMRAPTKISTVINQFKGYVTKQIGYTIWQKLFHDHIIRNEEEYCRIWQYIDENPAKWVDDCYYEKETGNRSSL